MDSTGTWNRRTKIWAKSKRSSDASVADVRPRSARPLSSTYRSFCDSQVSLSMDPDDGQRGQCEAKSIDAHLDAMTSQPSDNGGGGGGGGGGESAAASRRRSWFAIPPLSVKSLTVVDLPQSTRADGAGDGSLRPSPRSAKSKSSAHLNRSTASSRVGQDASASDLCVDSVVTRCLRTLTHRHWLHWCMLLLFIYLSGYLLIYLSIYLFIYLFIHSDYYYCYNKCI